MRLARNRVVLGGLYAYSLAKAFLRHKDPRRREASRHLAELYERAWREAAARQGATYQPLGARIGEITLGSFRTRVMQNYTPIDDPVTLEFVSNKPLTYHVLKRHGIATPPFVEFTLKEM